MSSVISTIPSETDLLGGWECGISRYLPLQSSASLLAPFITDRLIRKPALGSKSSIFIVGQTKKPTFTICLKSYTHSELIPTQRRTVSNMGF